MLYVVE
jgi:hypothetical protein